MMSAESSSASTKKKLFADESSFAQFQNNVRISDQNPSANGLPNFFVETILKKLPDEHGQNRHKNLMNSANLLEMTLSSEKTLVSAPLFRQFRTITDLLEDRTCSKNISLSQSREQVGLSQAFQCDATMQASLYANEELLHLSKVHMRAYNQWQQLLFSSICRTGFMANPRFYEYSRIAPSFLSDCFSSDFSYIRHFEHQNNSIVNIDKSAGIDSQAQSLPPVTASCSELNEHRKQQKSLSETENILFQLNELSEKIPVYCQTPNDQKTTEVLPSKERKLYRNSPSRLGLKLNTETSRASSSSVSNIFTATSSADSNEHPAWVFCTRYSDRPCAGPRVRKPRKVVQKPSQNICKRERTAFSEVQLSKLQKEFRDCPYLTEERRIRLSNDLGLSIAQIKVWFQNKRAKVKKASGIQSQLKMGLIASGIYEHGTIMTENQ